VKFRYQCTNNKYIVQREGLIQVLKNEDKNGIEFIKVFDFDNDKFKRISRKEILQNYTFDTESIEYLTNHYFFK
jgi:hypothetical protein